MFLTKVRKNTNVSCGFSARSLWREAVLPSSSHRSESLEIARIDDADEAALARRRVDRGGDDERRGERRDEVRRRQATQHDLDRRLMTDHEDVGRRSAE